MSWFWVIPYPIRAGAMLLLACLGILLIGHLYRTGPQASEKVWGEQTVVPKVPLVVDYAGDFSEPSRHAVAFWNDVMPDGQRLFVAAAEATWRAGEVGVRVLSATGEPCGKFSAHETAGHAATAYRCPDGSWEIHIAKPGHLRTQLCIVAHELGHVLGLADDGNSNKGVMNQHYCPDVDQGSLRPSDKDAEAIRWLYVLQEMKDGGVQD